MLRWWRINITKILCVFFNRTSLTWNKLKVAVKVICDSASGMYTWEFRYQVKHHLTVGGVKYDADVMANRYCAQRAMNCMCWVLEAGSQFLF